MTGVYGQCDECGEEFHSENQIKEHVCMKPTKYARVEEQSSSEELKFDKDATFHKCPIGDKIRPYPSYYCSMCMGKGQDINAYNYVLELEKRLKNET